jgi:hypothetical protein
MHFLFSLLRIKDLYMFRALIAHPQEALYKRHLVYCVRVKSVGCTRSAVLCTPILVQNKILYFSLFTLRYVTLRYALSGQSPIKYYFLPSHRYKLPGYATTPRLKTTSLTTTQIATSISLRKIPIPDQPNLRPKSNLKKI